jgi:hypothetical protein
MFDTLWNIPPDQPWKQFITQLDADELRRLEKDARLAGDIETADFALKQLKKCSSTTPPLTT